MATKSFDKQKVFNKVAKHLLKQNAKCGTPRGTCYYRGAAGMSCAIGCLIPDELYTPDIENMAIHALYDWDGETNTWGVAKTRAGTKKARLMEIIKGSTGAETYDDLRFLTKLQSVHDSCDVENWRSALRDVAEEFGLKAGRV